MKKNFFKRFLAFVMALCMCFGTTSMSAFAAESEAPADCVTTEDVGVMPMADGDVLTAGMRAFTNSTTLSLELTHANWSTDFCVTVLGNTGAKYEVVLDGPDDITATTYIAGGTSNLTLLLTLLYAPAGTYKFTFTRLSGSAISASAIAEIRD